MQKEKPPIREQDKELEDFKKLQVQDQLEYLLTKVQGHEGIIINTIDTLSIFEAQISGLSVKSKS